MKKTFHVVHKSGILLALLFIAGAANAADYIAWQPSTAAGGATVPPGFWEQEAAYRLGVGLTQNNVTLINGMTSTTLNDNSVHTANSVSGGQTNYTPIARDNGKLDVTITTTTTNP